MDVLSSNDALVCGLLECTSDYETLEAMRLIDPGMEEAIRGVFGTGLVPIPQLLFEESRIGAALIDNEFLSYLLLHSRKVTIKSSNFKYVC